MGRAKYLKLVSETILARPMRTAPYFNNHRFHKNICLIISVTSGCCPTRPVFTMSSSNQEGRRAHSAVAHGKTLRSVSSSAAGPQNPAAGDTGPPEPLQGSPDDSIEIARTVVGTGFLPESRKEATQQVRGSPRRLRPPICFGLPRTASLHYGGSRAVTVFLFPKKIPSKAVVSLIVHNSAVPRLLLQRKGKHTGLCAGVLVQLGEHQRDSALLRVPGLEQLPGALLVPAQLPQPD
jgi:hypothetical protein